MSGSNVNGLAMQEKHANHCFFVCLCLNYIHPCLAHAGHIGTDRSLLTEYDALFLRQIARDLSHAFLHRHNNTWTAFGEPVVSTGGDKLITY